RRFYELYPETCDILLSNLNSIRWDEAIIQMVGIIKDHKELSDIIETIIVHDPKFAAKLYYSSEHKPINIGIKICDILEKAIWGNMNSQST
ncbi:hypothetical protein MBAV_001203, partial [Candidatus Magnetobacterium bavaricum]